MLCFRKLALLAVLSLGLVATSTRVRADEFPSFIVLPDYVSTPDGMVVCPKTGDLLIACPNFGDPSKPACVVRVDKTGAVSKWFDVPVLEETGVARPMGIDLADDGSVFLCDNQNWPTGNGDDGELNQGRLLRVYVSDSGEIEKTVVVANGFSHPNGVKIKDGFAYVTVSCLPKVRFADEKRAGLLASAVYRFPIDAENIEITNTTADKNIYALFATYNKDCQYGADGIIFDKKGDLYIGNFGDGTLLKIVAAPRGEKFPAIAVPAVSCGAIPPLKNADGTPNENFLADATRVAMRTVDGVCLDARDGSFYVADFSNNAVAKVDGADRSISFFARSPDSDGLNGELNQPGEPCVWNGRLAVTCFDMVCDADKVNTKHDPQATVVFLPLAD